jgi:hypothetical protein
MATTGNELAELLEVYLYVRHSSLCRKIRPRSPRFELSVEGEATEGGELDA